MENPTPELSNMLTTLEEQLCWARYDLEKYTHAWVYTRKIEMLLMLKIIRLENKYSDLIHFSKPKNEYSVKLAQPKRPFIVVDLD